MAASETVKRVADAVAETFSLLDGCFEYSAEILTFRPAYPEAWSILEHLEHVALANHYLLMTIGKGCRTALKRAATAPAAEAESDLDLLAPIAEPGAFEWLPPSHMVPTGARSLSEIRADLRAQREECLGLLRRMPRGEGRLYSISMSVNRSGRLDMYQWLYFLAQHARYHLRLIEKAMNEFPTKR